LLVRRLVLLLLGIAAAVVLLRGRRAAEFVEVEFEDGAAIRLTSGVEARDLLGDARAILETT
jgi:hypothetical protein